MKRFASILFCLVMVSSTPAGAFHFSPRPNKAGLIQWRDWSAGSLAEAGAKDRLILLSLSAVWCHWCHVMDETTYSDDEVIAYLNSHVIPIRVDADLRPDIDGMYNQGGWPSTAILTPAGEIISGGNYIGPQELLARLKRAASLYYNDRARLEEMLRRRREAKRTGSFPGKGHTPSPAAEEIREAVQVLRNGFDREYGGFGTGQKFPDPEAVEFLLSEYERTGDRGIRDMVVMTLDRMAKGGIHDRAGGGFFRYATKRDWSEPHYEKMLGVNAGMIRNYAEAGRLLGRKDYLKVMDSTIGYVLSHLYDPVTGELYGSQDADEEYYRKPQRKGLAPPFVDKTVYADSASQMVSALAMAYEATGNSAYLKAAQQSADCMLSTMMSGTGGVLHARRNGVSSLPGMLADNARLGEALIDLYSLTGERRYLGTAGVLGRILVERFYDRPAGRFRATAAPADAAPSVQGILGEMNANASNYYAVRFLARLSYLSRDGVIKEASQAAMITLSGGYKSFSPHAGLYGNALTWTGRGALDITVVAGRGAAGKYLAAINAVFAPQKAVRVLDPREDAGEIQERRYPPRTAVYICSGKRCLKPMRDPGRVKEELTKFINDLRQGSRIRQE